MKRFPSIISIIKYPLLASLSFFLFLFFVAVLTYFYFAKDLVTKDSIMNRNDTGIILYDIKNRPFFTFSQAKYKKFIPLNEIPVSVRYGIIASEDKDFYSHPGFSVKAIIRSIIADLRNNDISYGGSTLTQQLVKNTLLKPERSFKRKYQEIVLASELERRYKKNDILEMYLNSVYFGEGAFGLEEAAQTYFGKPAKNLTLAESAMLIGILPAPTALSPISGDPDAAKQHQQMVLERMYDQRYISLGEKNQADKEVLHIKSRLSDINTLAPHFALMVRDELMDKFGGEQILKSGLRVYTTIDLDWQQYAEQVVRGQVENLRKDNVSNAASVIMDPKTSEIRALVGSYDWYDDKFGKVNLATTPRQPGSSFKPIVYVTALENHLITPATILQDRPTVFNNDGATYKPLDYDRRFRGPVTVRRALANSLNIPAVEVMSKVGVPATIKTAKNLGITTLSDESRFGLALVLGAGEVPLVEMTNAYAVFANNGMFAKATTISRIENKYGYTIYLHDPRPKEVIAPEYAFLISSILSDNRARSEEFGNALTISRTAAVKTGTTEDYKDAWTLGYTPSLAVGVWVGNNYNIPMDNIAGSLGAAPIWRSLMEKFLENTPGEEFTPAANIISASICRFNGYYHVASGSALTEFFVEGTQPPGYCPNTKIADIPNPTGEQQEIQNFPSQQNYSTEDNTIHPYMNQRAEKNGKFQNKQFRKRND